MESMNSGESWETQTRGGQESVCQERRKCMSGAATGLGERGPSCPFLAWHHSEFLQEHSKCVGELRPMPEDSNVRKEALGDICALDKEVISRWPWAVIRSDWLLCVWVVVSSLCAHSCLTQCSWLRDVDYRPS